MSAYAAAHLDEIEEIDDGRCPWQPVRHHFGITAFGINVWTGRDAGDRILNEHDESDTGDQQEELYFVQRGRARFELEGDSVDAPAGTFVFARPGARRTAFAEEPGTTIIAIGATPGKPFEPTGYEIWAPLRSLYDAGEYAAVADRLAEAADAHPEYPDLLYNAACCESLAGRSEKALDQLRRAIECSDRFRELAAEDSDLDAIREEPAFKELVG